MLSFYYHLDLLLERVTHNLTARLVKKKCAFWSIENVENYLFSHLLLERVTRSRVGMNISKKVQTSIIQSQLMPGLQIWEKLDQ